MRSFNLKRRARISGCLGLAGVAAMGLLPSARADDASREVPWALRPLVRPSLAPTHPEDWTRNPIDRLIAAHHRRLGVVASPPASARVLMRRAAFDLTGLPPTPEEAAEYGADGLDAYERLVDRLLESPRYGERWARHWMDIVHFAETHGHDEDAIREHAWPYRDYLIRAFNVDKPFGRFIEEQVAGDVLYPGDPQAVVATGFLAAGPWDRSSQMGIQDDTIDKVVAQYLDRDDMVTTTMATFVSLTVHCARCHDHKFDPITQGDYYALQAVFAGVDRADRLFDPDPVAHQTRRRLLEEQGALEHGTFPLERLSQPELARDMAAWEKEQANRARQWRVMQPDTIQCDPGTRPVRQEDGSVLFEGNRPDKDTYLLVARPGFETVRAVLLELLADPSLPRQGPGRQDNGNLHLSEITLDVIAMGGDGATNRVVLERAEADFNQDGWTVVMALDGDATSAWGIYPAVGRSHRAMFIPREPVECGENTRLLVKLEQLHGGGHLIGRMRLSATDDPDPALGTPWPPTIRDILAVSAEGRTEEERTALALHYLKERNRRELEALPAPARVYAATSEFEAEGNFKPARGPRKVHFLQRGDIHLSGLEAQPGALTCVPGLPNRFELTSDASEGERRAALARWLSARDNVLTWRSIANRVWQYHFGRGLTATPNDFGRMGEPPLFLDVLDWLACELRDHGGSIKHLHRMIMTSATYRQSSADDPANARVDPSNHFLWRMNLRRLEAESIRDSILQASGTLDLAMGGPSDRQFHLSPGVHVTPNLDYTGFDPDAPANFRRGVYRFIFRTVPDPWMQALDCPDASQWVPRREESMTAQQALAMMNQRFIIRQSAHMAARLECESPDAPGRVRRLFELALGRLPEAGELERVRRYADRHGLANACRVIFNSNEFVFVE